MQMPEVAIVILNWNGKEFLAKFLPSVIATTYHRKRIIVADNASTDDSVAFLQAHYPAVEIIVNSKNEGFAGGYNFALKQVNTDYYVLLNSDVEVTPGWIEPVIALMEQDHSIAACQPKLLAYNERTHFEYAGAAGGWIDSFGYPFTRGRVFDQVEMDQGQYDEASPCFWATGAAMFIRARLFHEAGGFDAHFFAHQEEIDLCWRLQLKGYKIYVQPRSVVYHVGGGTLPKGNSRKAMLNFRNNLIMMSRNLPVGTAIVKIPVRFLLDGITAWRALFTGDASLFTSVFKAHLGYLYWLFFVRNEFPRPEKSKCKLEGVYGQSVVWQYFIKKRKTFSEIVGHK